MKSTDFLAGRKVPIADELVVVALGGRNFMTLKGEPVACFVRGGSIMTGSGRHVRLLSYEEWKRCVSYRQDLEPRAAQAAEQTGISHARASWVREPEQKSMTAGRATAVSILAGSLRGERK